MAAQGDDEMDDLENMDKTACEEKLERLQEERERMREDTERLQEKLKALNNELAARKEESKKMEQDRAREQKKTTAASKTTKAQANAQDTLQLLSSNKADDRNRVKEYLQEKVKKQIDDQLGETLSGREKKLGGNGIRLFDEMDLLVRKSEKDRMKEPKVDTVLVTFMQPNVELQYHLSFRIDESTTAKKLQADACEYWGQSHLEYILKNTTGSKVHDGVLLQNCFQDEEEAHLILAKKLPRNTYVTDDEKQAITQRVGVPKKKTKAEKKDENLLGSRAKPEEAFYKGLKEIPGFWDFMRQRDKGQVDHLKRLKCRTMLVYSALAIATIVSLLNIREPGVSFTARYGIHKQMTRSHVDPETGSFSPGFYDVDSLHAIYAWFKSVAKAELFNEASDLRTENYFPGWLIIRMQKVKPPSHAACATLGWIPESEACAYTTYNQDSSAKSDIEAVEDYWEGNVYPFGVSKTGLAGRSPDDMPYRYQGSDNNIFHRVGYESFDTSGYRVGYSLQPGYGMMNETRQAFVDDMTALEAAEWIVPETKAVHMAFISYNGNFDLWVSNSFTFAVSPSGIIVPRAFVEVYLPVINEYSSHNEHFTLDIVRIILVCYIFFIQMPTQLRVTTWKAYIFASNGIADLGIVGVTIATFSIRFLVLSVLSESTIEIMAAHKASWVEVASTLELYTTQIVLDGVLFGLIVFRLMRMAILDRTTFVLWQSLSEAMRTYASFLWVLCPLLFGLIAIAESAWRSYFMEFRTWWSTTATTLKQLQGAQSPTELDEEEDVRNPWLVLLYQLGWSCVWRLVIVNTWIGILCSVYQKIRVQYGYRPYEDPYRWSELKYAEFLCWAPVKRVYCKLRGITIKKPGDDED